MRFSSISRASALLALLWGTAACFNYDQTIKPLPAAQVAGLFADHSALDRVVILSYGDAGSGNSRQSKVAELMKAVCAERGCNFAMAHGDNIYDSGVRTDASSKLRCRFEEVYEGLDFEFWTVLGNHDWRGNTQAEIDYTLKSKRWRMPHAWYAIPNLPDWLYIYGLETTLVDNQCKLGDTAKQRLEAQYAAARAGLCESKARWKIIFGHHFNHTSSKGRHGKLAQKQMQRYVHPLMNECGVQIMSSGHDHHLEMLEVDPAPGVHPRYLQIITGAAGKNREVLSAEAIGERPGLRQLFAEEMYGFNLYIFTPEALTIEFYGFEKGDDRPVSALTKPIFEKTYTRAEFAPRPQATP